MRPVETDWVAQRAADRHSPAASAEFLNCGLYLSWVFAHQMPAHMFDEGRNYSADITLAGIGLTGEAFVSGYLHEVEISPSRSSDQDFDPCDLHLPVLSYSPDACPPSLASPSVSWLNLRRFHAPSIDRT